MGRNENCLFLICVFQTYFWAVKYILTKVAAQGCKLATEKTVSKLFPVVSDVNGGGGDWTSAGTVTGFVLRRHSWFFDGGCFYIRIIIWNIFEKMRNISCVLFVSQFISIFSSLWNKINYPFPIKKCPRNKFLKYLNYLFNLDIWHH